MIAQDFAACSWPEVSSKCALSDLDPKGKRRSQASNNYCFKPLHRILSIRIRNECNMTINSKKRWWRNNVQHIGSKQSLRPTGSLIVTSFLTRFEARCLIEQSSGYRDIMDGVDTGILLSSDRQKLGESRHIKKPLLLDLTRAPRNIHMMIVKYPARYADSGKITCKYNKTIRRFEPDKCIASLPSHSIQTTASVVETRFDVQDISTSDCHIWRALRLICQEVAPKLR